MDLGRIVALRDVLAATGWLDRTRRLGRALRHAGHGPGGLLVVGTPSEEPWHLAAHLDEESRWSGFAELMPTLVRWEPPPGAPPHLAVGLDRLERAGRGETVFVVAPDKPPAELLERVFDARHDGATVLALDAGDKELEQLAHEALTVPTGPTGLGVPGGPGVPGGDEQRTASGLIVPGPGSELLPEMSFDLVSHLVSVTAGEPDPGRRTGVRRRLARVLDALSGPPPGR